jgi:hypothetical protein
VVKDALNKRFGHSNAGNHNGCAAKLRSTQRKYAVQEWALDFEEDCCVGIGVPIV